MRIACSPSVPRLSVPYLCSPTSKRIDETQQTAAVAMAYSGTLHGAMSIPPRLTVLNAMRWLSAVPTKATNRKMPVQVHVAC